jgi:hypothetical protein
MAMTWGKAAIEVLFGGPARCDLCRNPAIAFDAGRTRCEDHLTDDMRAHREAEERRGRPSYPGRPQVIQP